MENDFIKWTYIFDNVIKTGTLELSIQHYCWLENFHEVEHYQKVENSEIEHYIGHNCIMKILSWTDKVENDIYYQGDNYFQQINLEMDAQQ